MCDSWLFVGRLLVLTADDIANILFTSLGESSTKAHPRRPGELIGEQAKLLQDLWTAFDADGSGKLEQDEVQKVIEAAMERILTESELTGVISLFTVSFPSLCLYSFILGSFSVNG